MKKMKIKKKVRYVSPRITGTSALLLDLLCASVRFNIQVDPLRNMNDPNNPIGDYNGESFYFES